MLTHIARFESRYVLRNPLLWATAAATFALFVAATSVNGFDLGSEGGLAKNATYATLRNYLMVSLFFMFVTTSFVANAVLRDDETGFGPILRSTGITKLEYVLGRFLGAFAVTALCMLALPLGAAVGALMPWAPAAPLGPSPLATHLYGYFLLALPNLFIHGSVLFALATMTRSMMATYLGVVSFVAAFLMLPGVFNDLPDLQTALAVAEPLAGRALNNATESWTIAQRNVLLPDFTGSLLLNRLCWIGIAILCLALACAAYRFRNQPLSRRERRRLKLVHASSVETAPPVETAVLPNPEHGFRALRALFWLRIRFEARQVVLSPPFFVLMAWWLCLAVFVLITQRQPASAPIYPTTLTLVPIIYEVSEVILLVIAIFYAGELVWRERDRRIHEIVDATPLPNWAYVVPKTVAMALVLMAALLMNVIAAIILQLSLGFTELELGKYLVWYVLPTTWDMLLLAVLAVFAQALSPHKAVGWAVMVVFLQWQLMNNSFNHTLLKYGTTPDTPLSDMNGAGSFWWGAWTVRVYWGAFAVLLLVAAHLLWRRGTEIRLRPRLAAARRRLTRAPGMVAAVALVVFAGTGAYAFYNTNVLNEYRSQPDGEARLAALEKKYWKYHALPQPTITDMRLTIDLYPAERRALTKGRYLLRNLTSQAITDIHVRLLYDDVELTSAAIAGARLISDDAEFDYRIYRLDSPMRPGEERVLTFETRRWHRGFVNEFPSTILVENGTFLANRELTPVIGMGPDGTIDNPIGRAKYGLPKRGGQPELEDVSATAKAADLGGWTTTDITLSTSADQTPIAPGRRMSDVIRGDRRIARFKSEAPIREKFAIQSARYAEKHRSHGATDLVVYYHPAHAWNVDRMLDQMSASLDVYEASFGPYPFEQLRIVEFPGYQKFAPAFAGTIPYSETVGFIRDVQPSEPIGHGTVAHDVAHQYWGQQLIGADMQGSLLLSETLAHYSALMVLKKQLGAQRVRPHLQQLLDGYLADRAFGPTEPPLIRVSQNWLAVQKGALAMYLLQERMGEAAVNRALSSLLQRFRFKGPPYPRSTDLVAALRAQARTEEQRQLIADLFERVVLYDLKVTGATAVQRVDGK